MGISFLYWIISNIWWKIVLFHCFRFLYKTLFTEAEHVIFDVIVLTFGPRPYSSLYPPRWYNFHQLCVYLRGKPDLISARVVLFCSCVGNCMLCIFLRLTEMLYYTLSLLLVLLKYFHKINLLKSDVPIVPYKVKLILTITSQNFWTSYEMCNWIAFLKLLFS